MIQNKEMARQILINLKINGFLNTPVNGAKMKWLRKNHSILIDVAEQYVEKYHLKKLTEAFYWIINNIESYPECSLKLDNKCNNKPSFINYFKGYNEACGNCSKHKPGASLKMKETCLKKYGVSNVSKCDFIKKKVIETTIKHYGTARPIQNKEIMKKMKQTMLNKYGVTNANNSEELKKKATESLQKSWNNPERKKDILNKTKQTYLEHYGVEHYSKTEQFRQDIIDAWNNSGRYEKVKSRFLDRCKSYNIELLEDMECSKNDYKFKCTKCGTEGVLNTIGFVCGKYYWCTKCHPHSGSASKGEKDVLDYIMSYYPNQLYFENDRKILNGKELDMYFPDLQLAIEYCGLIWHATKPTGLFGGGYEEDYHINKFKECFDKKIRLITLYEDEWMRFENRDNIKNRLSKFIGNCKIINGNDCDICEITKEEFEEYLNQNSYFNQLDFNQFYKLMFENDIVCVIGKNDDGVMLFEDNTLSFENYNFLSTKFGFDCLIYDNRWPINTFDSRIYKNQIGWAFGKNIDKITEEYLETGFGIIHDCGYSIIKLKK